MKDNDFKSYEPILLALGVHKGQSALNAKN
jgi:hypothetical protein